MSRHVMFGLALLLSSAGCGPGAGTVQGTVKHNGEPLDKGLVTFSPIGNVGGTAGGEITNGEFKVENLVPAKYQVHVEAILRSPKIVNPGDPETKLKLTSAEKNALADPLPADTIGKDQEIEIKVGEQKMEFVLKSPGGR